MNLISAIKVQITRLKIAGEISVIFLEIRVINLSTNA